MIWFANTEVERADLRPFHDVCAAQLQGASFISGPGVVQEWFSDVHSHHIVPVFSQEQGKRRLGTSHIEDAARAEGRGEVAIEPKLILVGIVGVGLDRGVPHFAESFRWISCTSADQAGSNTGGFTISLSPVRGLLKVGHRHIAPQPSGAGIGNPANRWSNARHALDSQLRTQSLASRPSCLDDPFDGRLQ